MVRTIVGAYDMTDTKEKRPRKPRQPKPGFLTALWGKMSRGEDPELCYAWGEGIPKCDARLLNSALCSPYSHETSFYEELENRGYDMTTLKFSIKLKD